MSYMLAPQSYSDNGSKLHFCFYRNSSIKLYGFFSFADEKFHIVSTLKRELSRSDVEHLYRWLSKYDYELSAKSAKRFIHTEAYWYIEWLKSHAVFNYNKLFSNGK